MKRYISTVRTLFSIASDKLLAIICMFISCSLYNLSSLLPPVATSGIIAVVTQGNFSGIWYYVLLYLVFY